MFDRYGVVYFRGFPVDSHQFEHIVDTLSPERFTLEGGFSRRHHVHGSIYTANDSPPPLMIKQHHELAYHGMTPRYVIFYCDHPAETGGATPVADGLRFFRTMEELFPSVIAELEHKGVLYIRNYNDKAVKPWPETWWTDSKVELEEKLKRNVDEYEWLSDDWLRTKQRRPGIVRDPLTGGKVVYASINLWVRSFVEEVNTVWNVPQSKAQDPYVQPFATLFGDGSEIPTDFVAAMNRLYEEQKIVVPYEPHDFMFINNFTASHGRTPYTGPDRRIFVTMRDPVHHSQLPRVPARRGAAS